MPVKYKWQWLQSERIPPPQLHVTTPSNYDSCNNWRRHRPKNSVGENPRPQLDVAAVGPLTELMINRLEYMRASALPVFISLIQQTYIHTSIVNIKDNGP